MTELSTGQEVAPFVYVYENVIDNCQEIIDLSMEQNWEWASISTWAHDFERGGGPDDSKSVWYFEVVPTVKVDPKWFWLLRSMWQHAEQYGKENKADFKWVESINIFKYSTGDYKYSEHFDSFGHERRVVSAVLFLNDVEEGGELVFPKFDVSIKPKAGRMVVFPSNFAWQHLSKPPTSNEKFAVATWFSD